MNDLELMESLINKHIIDELKDKLLESKQTIAVAESVTSGLLQAILSSATDATLFFQGGITAYNLGQKILHLGVEPIHAEQCNCVSEKVAAEMAIGAIKMFKSDWGVGITGFASPVPESGNKTFAYCAIVYKDEVLVQQKLIPTKKEFFDVQLEFAKKAIDLLLEKLK